jgi:hypothetical protein
VAGISKILSGVSGEYFVGAELSRRGYIASLTSKNTKGIDLLASNEDASITVGIQVKTNQGEVKSWLLNKSNEVHVSNTLFYVFVSLNGIGMPDYHIVPSCVVAETISKEHAQWLKTPGKNGIMRNDTNMRAFTDKNNQYLNRWDMLGLDSK